MSDALSDALDALRVSTTLYAFSSVGGPWGVSFPGSAAGAYFHLVRGSSCWLTVDEPEQLHRVGDGDVVLLPHGSGHRLTASPGGAVRTTFDPVTWTAHRHTPAEPGTEGERTHLVCGAVRVLQPSSHPLLRLLPAVVAVRAGSPGAQELHLTGELLAAETRGARPGADALLARLGDVLLVQLLRIWALQQQPSQRGWLAALVDPGVGAALTALHADPAAPWTVESLAAVAGMSRSRFAERFTALAGQPPLTYLAGWRMTRAAALLEDPAVTVRTVGRRVGFSSEPAFSRAFTRHHGQPPARYRRSLREASTS